MIQVIILKKNSPEVLKLVLNCFEEYFALVDDEEGEETPLPRLTHQKFKNNMEPLLIIPIKQIMSAKAGTIIFALLLKSIRSPQCPSSKNPQADTEIAIAELN